MSNSIASKYSDLAWRHSEKANEAFQNWTLRKEQKDHAEAMLHAQMATMYAGMATAAKLGN
ncbi:hypothetical protein [Streptomyces antimicrobicus]|uniref:Uncharacterized protein n=1 Tax=Streptomyces antimicrobicus TaxID=2883108 RepID=A0ABS8B051_9ACTN|nr:hypothetical protein [Streptomyces antimicrobicus]MCB5177940.1 hypothetical protein [Streptomyces antimicrobicus]